MEGIWEDFWCKEVLVLGPTGAPSVSGGFCSIEDSRRNRAGSWALSSGWYWRFLVVLELISGN